MHAILPEGMSTGKLPDALRPAAMPKKRPDLRSGLCEFLRPGYFLIRPKRAPGAGLTLYGLVAPGTSCHGPVTDAAACNVPPPVHSMVMEPSAFLVNFVNFGCSATTVTGRT